MISVKLTDEEKKALDKLAFDQDDSVSRLIRQALLKTHPEIFDRGEEWDGTFRKY
tara:strand:- start:3209 stop:3373 length:165 start_codon:yes stop_codon:yes gene_type:complete